MDGKDEAQKADIFDGRAVLTPELEERLYRQYWGKLMGVARRYIPDRDVAREVVNDSFIKAFANLSGFRGQGAEKPIVLQAWLIRITVNTAIDRLRTQRTSPHMASIDGLENHPAVEMEDTLHVDDILGLLQQLPALHRVVFNLYELEGYSHEEISKRLAIPTSSSRVYLTKAKQRLRALYRNYFEGRRDG